MVYTCADEYIQPYETSIITGATNIDVGCNGQFIGHVNFFYNSDLYVVIRRALTKPLSHPAATNPADPAMNPAADTGGCTTGEGATDGAIGMLGAMLLVARRRRPHNEAPTRVTEVLLTRRSNKRNVGDHQPQRPQRYDVAINASETNAMIFCASTFSTLLMMKSANAGCFFSKPSSGLP